MHREILPVAFIKELHTSVWAEPWFFTCSAHLLSIDDNQQGCA